MRRVPTLFALVLMVIVNGGGARETLLAGESRRQQQRRQKQRQGQREGQQSEHTEGQGHGTKNAKQGYVLACGCTGILCV